MITETTLKLQRYRKRLGWTQLKACIELRIPIRTWQGWENDGREPAPHEWLYLELVEEKRNADQTLKPDSTPATPKVVNPRLAARLAAHPDPHPIRRNRAVE